MARASLEELRVDYEDYLRVRNLKPWGKDSREARYVRNVRDDSYETYRDFAETRSGDVVANIAICLIHQANYLLDRQIGQLERAFVEKGGLRERMTRERLRDRGQ